MDEALEVLILVGMFLFMGAIFGFVIYSWRHTNKRDGRSDQQQEELVQFVEGRGWTYTAFVPGGADRYCGGPPLPIKGVNVPLWDCITGEFRGRAFCCFEYRSRSMNADGPNTWRHSAAFAVTMPTSGPRMIDRGQRHQEERPVPPEAVSPGDAAAHGLRALDPSRVLDLGRLGCSG